MKIPSDLQSFAEMVQTKRHHIKTNEQMRKDYYVIKKTKLIAAKAQGWRRKRKKLKKEYRQELHRYYLNANHFFTEQDSRSKNNN